MRQAYRALGRNDNTHLVEYLCLVYGFMAHLNCLVVLARAGVWSIVGLTDRTRLSVLAITHPGSLTQQAINFGVGNFQDNSITVGTVLVPGPHQPRTWMVSRVAAVHPAIHTEAEWDISVRRFSSTNTMQSRNAAAGLLRYQLAGLGQRRWVAVFAIVWTTVETLPQWCVNLVQGLLLAQ
jgi:hypothetical protein